MLLIFILFPSPLSCKANVPQIVSHCFEWRVWNDSSTLRFRTLSQILENAEGFCDGRLYPYLCFSVCQGFNQWCVRVISCNQLCSSQSHIAARAWDLHQEGRDKWRKSKRDETAWPLVLLDTFYPDRCLDLLISVDYGVVPSNFLI